MMNILSYIALFLLVIGGFITYMSKKVAPVIFKGEERNEEADNLKTKMIGFVIALVGAVALFILKK